MTIELITGTPGAGKTTYAVAERVAVECKRVIKTEDGTERTRRVLAAGVRGLVLDHERLPHKLTGERVTDQEVEYWNAMQTGDEPLFVRLAGDPPVTEVVDPATGEVRAVRPLVQNWWLWCQPGDLIVVDECQFLAPRGVMGRKPPYWIQALEIHRHYGVDFIIITQHPQLIDTVIRNLVGLHKHVRSMLGTSLCLIYSWDHASNPERVMLASKKFWRRRAKHYKLFHSSVAHVAPPTAGRVPLGVAVVLVVGVVYGMTSFFGKLTGSEAATVDSALVDTTNAVKVSAAADPVQPAASQPEPELRIAGCVAPESPGQRGFCVDSQGKRVDMPPDVVDWNARNMGGFINYDLTPSSGSYAPQRAPAPAPEMAGPGGFSDPSPRPNPVRPLAGGLVSIGGVPSSPAPDVDGSILAEMRAR